MKFSTLARIRKLVKIIQCGVTKKQLIMVCKGLSKTFMVGTIVEAEQLKLELFKGLP